MRQVLAQTGTMDARPCRLESSWKRAASGKKLMQCSARTSLRLGAPSRGLQIRCAAPPQTKELEYYDADKELSRKYRQTVFTHEDWFKHRSTSRYKRHIAGLLESRIVRGLAFPLGTVVTVSALLTVYEALRESGQLPPWCFRLALDTAQPFNLTSFALSLLLVFRTNASYGRWDESRKLWGGVVNRTRDLTRQGLTFIPQDKPALRAMHVRWVQAMPFSMKCHLTYNSDLRSDLQGILEPNEIDALMKATHRPNYVYRVLANIINNSDLSEQQVFLMDKNLTYFADAIGACERILTTPIPLSWTRHTSRFLVIWLAVLPFLLFSSCKFATAPVAAIVSFLLLGIEEIGVQIEEPFSILPLDAICNRIKNVLAEMYFQAEETDILTEEMACGEMEQANSRSLPVGGNGWR